MARRRAVILVAVVTVAIVALVPTAAAHHTNTQWGTWRGAVSVHEDHFQYTGSPCPIQAQQCVQVIANYRVVPVTWEAFYGLHRVTGRQARLIGVLDPTPNQEHQGTLYVWRVLRSWPGR